MPNITTNHAITYTNTTNWHKNQGGYRLSVFFSQIYGPNAKCTTI